jgi:hypothetical protein
MGDRGGEPAGSLLGNCTTKVRKEEEIRPLGTAAVQYTWRSLRYMPGKERPAVNWNASC